MLNIFLESHLLQSSTLKSLGVFNFFVGIYFAHFCAMMFLRLQLGPERMRLEMRIEMPIETHIEMQIEILDGGEIRVKCKFKLISNLNVNLYHEIQRHLNETMISSRICIARYTAI